MPHTGISFNSTVLYCPSAWLNDGATAHDTTYTQTLGFFWPFILSLQTNGMQLSQLSWFFATFINQGFPGVARGAVDFQSV